MPVVVEIEAGDVVSRVEDRRREQTEVGDIDVPVAIDIAEETIQTLRLAKVEIVAGDAVAVAIELAVRVGDLRSEDRQLIPAVEQRAEFRYCPIECEHHAGGRR